MVVVKSTPLNLDADCYTQRIFLTHSTCINPHLQTIAAHVCRRFACCRSLCNCRILADQNWGFHLRLLILQSFYESNLQSSKCEKKYVCTSSVHFYSPRCQHLWTQQKHRYISSTHPRVLSSSTRRCWALRCMLPTWEFWFLRSII